MSLFLALDISEGDAVYTFYRPGWVRVTETPDGQYLISAVKLEDGRNPQRKYEQTVPTYDELVTRIALLPFGCDVEAGWEVITDGMLGSDGPLSKR